MTILEDWPSLPPIRTSSGRDSRVSCETLSLYDSTQSHTSDKALPAHALDTFFPLPSSDDVSPPRSATSAFGLVASRTSERGHLFSCFFPNKSASHALYKSMMSPGRDGRKSGSDVGTVFRSFVGFSIRSGAVTHSSKVGSGPLAGHPLGLKGYTVSSKGHAGNVFTMMPPDVVGKKKPPGYESDEPTSPEVTCIGKVRRKKHCKAWDALVKENKCRDRKSKKPGFVSPRRLNLVLVSPRAEKQLQYPSRTLPSRRKQLLLRESETESPCIGPLRVSNTESSSSDPDPDQRSSSISQLSSRVDNSDLGLLPQFPSEGENSDAADEGSEVLYQPPPPNCLLRMRNTGRSKEHYANGELLGVSPESADSLGSQADLKPSNNGSLWKRRMVKLQPPKLELRA